MLEIEESKFGELETRKLEKIERNIFKKFYHLNTKRILTILGYTPS